MGFDTEKSIIMANRLKQLREGKGLSHEKLSRALYDQYQVKISPDSLMNYEVSDPGHTKAYKNQGMRVEYLRCLADFYGVSADYILGADVPMSTDVSVREIVNKTGLTEDNVVSLIAWANLPIISQLQDNEDLTDIERRAIDKAARIGTPRFAQYLCINLIRKLISAVTDRADDMCNAFNSYMLCVQDNKNFKWGRRPKSITKEIFTDIAKQGYRIVPAREAMRLEWEHISKILCYEFDKSLLSDLERRGEANGND